MAATLAGDLGQPDGRREVAEAALAAPPGPDPPRAVDVLLDALALRLTQGYAAAAQTLARALELLLTMDVSTAEGRRWLWLAGGKSRQHRHRTVGRRVLVCPGHSAGSGRP